MSGTSDRLDRNAHDRVFREVVRAQSGLDELASHERPKVIIPGGQPGSSKGNLKIAAKAELHGDVITIDPDELRDFHPRVEEFRAAKPYSWSGRTHRDASGWAGELGEAAVAGKKNVIIDTTLGDSRRASQLIGELPRLRRQGPGSRGVGDVRWTCKPVAPYHRLHAPKRPP